MTTISDILVYIIKNYPYKNDLSNARLTKMVYLVDWKACLVTGNQLTNIKWKYNHYGPYVDDIIETSKKDNIFKIVKTKNLYGFSKKRVELKDEDYNIKIDEESKKIINHVINATKDLYWKDFINLVYSTHPIISNNKFEYLNLVKSAKEYKKNNNNDKEKVTH